MRTYDGNNRLLTEARDVPGTASDTFTVYGYDATVQTGKTVHQGLNASGTVLSHATYAYDVQGQLKTAEVVADGNDVTDTYAYDDNGIRTSKQTGSATTEYVIDPNNPTGYAQVLEEWNKSGSGSRSLSRSYVWMQFAASEW
jgi:hypothetical protein